MSETTTKEFEPITTQEQLDTIIKNRLAREREKWEKDNGTNNLKTQLEAKDEEVPSLKRSHYLEDARRAVIGDLASKGVTDEGRIERVLRHVDLEAIEPNEDGQPDRRAIQGQLAAIGKDMPELLTYRVGAGSGGSERPVVRLEEPLTRDEVEKMSPEEINSRWDTVRKFLAGERG